MQSMTALLKATRVAEKLYSKSIEFQLARTHDDRVHHGQPHTLPSVIPDKLKTDMHATRCTCCVELSH